MNIERQFQMVAPVEEAWFKSRWRPAMAWSYMAIVLFDFLFAPLIQMAFAIYTKTDLVSWIPITLAEGGLFHMAMGAILGLAAWTRGQEKIRRIDRGYYYSEDSPPRRSGRYDPRYDQEEGEEFDEENLPTI